VLRPANYATPPIHHLDWLALWQNATCGKLLPLQLLVPLLKSAWPKHKGRRSSSTLFKSVGPSARDQFPTVTCGVNSKILSGYFFKIFFILDGDVAVAGDTQGESVDGTKKGIIES